MVKVDEEKCIGCGSCEAICPQVFKMGEGNKSKVISQDCSKCDCEAAKNACPTGAISL